MAGYDPSDLDEGPATSSYVLHVSCSPKTSVLCVYVSTQRHARHGAFAGDGARQAASPPFRMHLKGRVRTVEADVELHEEVCLPEDHRHIVDACPCEN